MRGQVFCQPHGVGYVCIHAQAEGFQTLQEEERIERGQAGAEVAQLFNPQLGAEPVLTKVVPESQPAIAGHWFGHAWEPAVRPVKVAALHHHATHRGAVASDELRGGMHQHVYAMFEGAAQIRGRQGRVHHERYAGGVGYFGQRLEIGYGP